MTTWCAICSTDRRPIEADFGHVCSGCGNRILRDLRNVEHCVLALSAVPVKGGDGGRRSPGFGSQSPARDSVIVHTDVRSRPDENGDGGALATVHGWARLVRRERGFAPHRERVTITGECDALRASHEWVCRQEWVSTYAQELHDALRAVQGLLGLSFDKPVGRCTVDGCGGALFALQGEAAVECRRCWHEYRGVELIRLRCSGEAD